MRILLVGYLNPFENVGGVERYIQNLATGLHDSLGLKVELNIYKVDILVAGSKYSVNNTDIGKVITMKVPFFKTRFFFISKYFYALKARSYIKTQMSNYDVFHFHGDNGFIGKEFAERSILTIHGIALSTGSIVKRITSFLPSRIERNNAMKAQMVFSISVEAAKFFAKFAKSQIRIIKQTVDTDLYKPLALDDKLSLKNELGFPQDSIIGIIIGTDPERKGLFTAIRAVEAVKHPGILLVGIGFPDVNIESVKYRHLGKIDEKTKLKYIQAADFFILPSMKEGFPISALEAASAAVPLIVSENSGVAELKGLVPYFESVDSLDSEAYRIAIEKFIEFLTKNRNRVFIQDRNLLEQYSIREMIRVYLGAYESL